MIWLLLFIVGMYAWGSGGRRGRRAEHDGAGFVFMGIIFLFVVASLVNVVRG